MINNIYYIQLLCINLFYGDLVSSGCILISFSSSIFLIVEVNDSTNLSSKPAL